MSVAACTRTFILLVLCGNPILKGTFITLLNTIIAQLLLERDLLTLQIARLNILNQITSLGINAMRGAINQVKTNLNLFVGPLQQFPDCVDLSKLNETIQSHATGRTLTAINKKLYDLQRGTNLVRVQNAIKQKTDEQIRKLQDIINEISSLCP